jgi:FixJ family two-component response regulator
MQTDAMSAVSAAQQRRVAALSRAYQRLLAHKPTVLEKALIDRLAKAEAVALDPATSTADFYRADSIARKARAEFDRIVAKRVPAPAAPLPLREQLRLEAEQAG